MCFLPMTHLPFEPSLSTTMKVEDLMTGHENRAVETLSQLDDLCKRDVFTCRTAIWTLVSLGVPPTETPRTAVGDLWRAHGEAALGKDGAAQLKTQDVRGFRTRPGTAGGKVLFLDRDRPDVLSKLTLGARGLETDLVDQDTKSLDAGFLTPRINPWLMKYMGVKPKLVWFITVSEPVAPGGNQ